jgi:hypothetical protein
MPSAVSRSSSVDRTSEPFLFALAPLLRQFVVVELALDASCGAMEEIDGRPEQVLEVRFERVAQGRDEGVEDVCDGSGHGIAFGKRSGIGLVLEGTIAVELQLIEDVIGRG